MEILQIILSISKYDVESGSHGAVAFPVRSRSYGVFHPLWDRSTSGDAGGRIGTSAPTSWSARGGEAVLGDRWRWQCSGGASDNADCPGTLMKCVPDAAALSDTPPVSDDSQR